MSEQTDGGDAGSGPRRRFSRRRFVAAAGTGVAAAVAGCSALETQPDVPRDEISGAGWPTLGHDFARTSWHGSSLSLTNPSIQWQYETTRPVYELVVGGDTVYLSGAGATRAVDAASGTERWQSDIPEGYRWTPPTVARGLVFPTGTPSEVVGLDRETGDVAWRASLPEGVKPSVAPVVDDGRQELLVGASGQQLLWIDIDSGEITQTHDVSGYVLSPPAVNDGAFVATATGMVYRVSPSRWEHDLGGERNGDCAPVAGEQRLYVGCEGRVAALSKETGERLWTREIDNFYPTGELALAGKRLFVTHRWKLHALDVESGANRWTYGEERGLRVTTEHPAVAGDTVYVGVTNKGKDQLVALDVSGGELRWSVEVPETLYYGLTVTNDRVYGILNPHASTTLYRTHIVAYGDG